MLLRRLLLILFKIITGDHILTFVAIGAHVSIWIARRTPHIFEFIEQVGSNLFGILEGILVIGMMHGETHFELSLTRLVVVVVI